ncbi:MAG: metallophosphoesterase family protein [Candidatus Methanomethylicaceae archaeon]
MKIGIVADIHGNLPALQAVLADMPPVDLFLCCGDIVGYYPDANEVCALLRERQAFVVRGNHDAYLTGELQPDPTKSAPYQIEWTRANLEASHLRWLATLPIELKFKWGPLQLTVRHASPWDEETYLYPDSPRLAEITLEAGEILVVGHTHRPMRVEAGRGVVLNPGSVGQPRDWNPHASYALFETQTEAFEIIRVPYPVNEFQSRLEALGWNENLIRILSRTGRKS